MARKEFPSLRLSDIANAAGVGESTVSRVLRNSGSVSAETRDRVRQVVAALGYVPNRIAGTLAAAGSRVVGIVVPSLTNIVFPDLLRGAAGQLDLMGYQAVIGVSDYDGAREAELVASMLAWRPAAVMITGLEHERATPDRLRSSGARVVEMLDVDGEGLDIVVGYSNRAAAMASARHLIGRGYRRIGYVGHEISRDTRAAKRLAGFEAELAEHRLSLIDRELHPGPSSIAAGRDGLERLLARAPALDAVYFSNDDMAIGGYFHCVARGIAIPERLALFGFNGLDVARLAPQPLATILTPRVEIGQQAARLALSDEPAATVDLGFTLIEGATA